MRKKKNSKQIIATALLFFAGLILGLAVGLLLIPKNQYIPVEITDAPSVPSVVSAEVPFLGNKESKVQIVEYTDFECPFCKDYYEQIFNGPLKKYLDEEKIGYTFKDYPLAKYSHNVEAALAAHCSGEQNSFWPMHSNLFQKQETWAASGKAVSVIKNFAQELGLNESLFAECLDSQKYLYTIQKNIDSAGDLNVRLTPTVFVNDIIIEGLQTPEYYIQVIEAEITKFPEDESLE